MKEGISKSEINLAIRMQKITLFLYKESTVFWFFLPFFMVPSLYSLLVHGFENHLNVVFILNFLFYLPIYNFVILEIKPFKYLKSEFAQIKEKLEQLVSYKLQRFGK